MYTAVPTGKIVQIIGAVIDVEFPRDQIPKLYDALKLEDADVTLEAQQQLGDGTARPARRSRCPSARRRSAASWTSSARRRTRRARFRRKTSGRFTDQHRRTTNKRAARSCSSLASRSSTF